MSWLSGFSNRLKLTIPADSADSSLTNFPVMINLSSSSGKTGFDTTAVFDELGDDHQKRFAITKNDGTTQCPVEIEYWDATEEKAVLWTKIPTVYSSVDTDVFFYFDATVSGNISYVGDVGDAPAQNVWDSNFVGIWHMAQDPNGDITDAIKDSTSNANHGTPVGSMTTDDLVDGKIGKCIDFDSADDYIDCGSSTSLLVNVGLFEACIRAEDSQVTNARILCAGNTADRVGLYLSSTTTVHFYGLNSPTSIFGIESTITADGDTFHSIAGSWDTTEAKLYVDGVEEDSWSGDATLGLPATTPVFIGEYIGGGNYRFHGLIDEVRISNTARSDAWIKATYHSNWDDFIVFQQEEIITNWLSDWPKRIKLTIDKDKIDSTLVDFPVNITLASGTNASSVFSELSTVSGTKKIAITTDDGTTQCYVEIERWDWAEEEANLWTKVPAVDSNEDTVLYLYYDSTKSDNTTYIGDTGDTPAQSVWDDNFKLVTHMAQDPNGDVADAIKDSTSNAHHMTPNGSMTTADLVDGKIGKGIDFDGTNDYLEEPDHADFDITDYMSIHAIFNMNYTRINEVLGLIAGKCTGNSPDGGYGFFVDDRSGSLTNAIRATIYNGTGNRLTLIYENVTEGWHDLYLVYDKDLSGTARLKLYLDGVSVGTYDSTGDFSAILANNLPIRIGRDSGTGSFYADSVIDETSISNTARSAAWIKATYYSNWDDLISFGSEQGIPTHYYYGYVTEEETPISRTVMLYYRNTGELVGYTTSDSETGYYYLTTTISGEHFIVTIDNDAGKDYNALVLDKLLPRGIE